MTDIAVIRRDLAAALSQIYAPGCTLNAWQWAEKNIFLDREESADNSGNYDTALTPFVRRVMEFITVPAEVENELFIRKSAQLGFTLAYLIIICYLAATSPGHVLFGMDSAKEAKNISIRLKRLIRGNASLAGVLTEEGEEDLQNLLINLRGMTVYLVGSGAEGAWANKSCRVVFIDELDKGDPATNTVSNGRDRLKGQSQGKLIAGGTPNDWLAPTNQNWLTGTREEFHMPCPHCGHLQPFDFDRLKFDHCKDLVQGWDYGRLLTETYMECASAACPVKKIPECHKAAMLRAGVWVAHNVRREVTEENGLTHLAFPDEHRPYPRRASLWINDLYSLSPKQAWGELALRFIGARASVADLALFYHTTLGLPREEKKTELKAADVRRLCRPYAHGVMPAPLAVARDGTGDRAVILAVDKQSDHKRWAKVAFTPAGDAYIVDYGRTLGVGELIAIAAEPVWLNCEPLPAAELDALKDEAQTAGVHFHALLRERHPDRPFAVVSIGIIDEGFETWVVRDFCYQTQNDPACPVWFFPAKGVEKIDGAREKVEQIQDRFRTTQDGQNEGRGPCVTVYHFNDAGMKSDLYLGRIASHLPGAPARSGLRSERLFLPRDAEEDFVSELSQERRGEQIYKGRPRMVWLVPEGCNDGGDAVKLSLVMWLVEKHRYVIPAAVLTPAGKIVHAQA